MGNQQELVDIPKILKAKSPKLAKRLPKFIVRYLERILHVKDVNYILSTYGHLQGLDFVEATLNDLNVTYTVRNPEHLPPADGKRYVFVSNHPLGALDGLVLMEALGKVYNGKVKFIVNDLLLNLKPLDPIFVPVNTFGKQSDGYVNRIDETFASDDQVLYFPAGFCSRKIKGKIMDLEWKKSVVAKAVKHERDIVPIFFTGRNSNFFYNLSNICRFFGMKFDLSTLYLSDELFKQRGSSFELVIGKPIPYTTFDKGRTMAEWAAYLKDIVYALPAGMPQG